MKNSIQTWLPVFPGFYGTDFEANEDQEIEHITDERGNLPELPYDAYKFNYSKYQDEIGSCACDVMLIDLQDFITDIDFESVNCPKEYNFGNDSIHCTIQLSEDNKIEIIAFLTNHYKQFSKYLQDNYTSGPGFTSSYSNDIEHWLYPGLLDQEHELGAVLQFIWYQEHENDGESKENAESDFHYEVVEGISLECENYDDCCNDIYCPDCKAFANPRDCTGNICDDCFQTGRPSGEHIACAHCLTEINNPWIKRSLQFQLVHHLIKIDQIRCDVCAISIPNPIGQLVVW